MAARPKKLCPVCHERRPITIKDTFVTHYFPPEDGGATCPMSGKSAVVQTISPEEHDDPLVGFLVGNYSGGYGTAQLSHRHCPWKLSVDSVSLAELVEYANLHLPRCPARETLDKEK